MSVYSQNSIRIASYWAMDDLKESTELDDKSRTSSSPAFTHDMIAKKAKRGPTVLHFMVY